MYAASSYHSGRGLRRLLLRHGVEVATARRAVDQGPAGSQDFIGRDSVSAEEAWSGQVEGSGIDATGAEHGGIRGENRRESCGSGRAE